ncbi:MAG: hypothetical protein ABIJ12_06270 [bacterium]
MIGSLFGINTPVENPVQSEIQLGATVPTVVALFSTTLASAITSTATSFTLTSGTTEDGTTLSGTYGFVIDEGTSSEEFVLATCVDTACTGATRGVSAITGNTTITALKSSHSRGASVKISDHPQLAIISRIVNGDESFPNALDFDGMLTYTSSGMTSLFTTYDIVNKDYVDTAVTAGAPNASTTVKGIVEEATDAELAAGTAAGGTSARLFAGGASHSETPGANKVCVANASSLLQDGWLGLTTAGDMAYGDGIDFARLAIGSANYYLTTDGSTPSWGGANLAEANTAFGLTDITGAQLEDLSDGGTTTLHTHTYKSGVITRVMNAGNGAVTTAHGLGRTPTFVRFTGKVLNSSGIECNSVGTYNGSTTATIVESCGTAGSGGFSSDTTNAVSFIQSAGTTWSEKAVVTVDATNITLTWTEVATTGAITAQILWEAY